MIDWFFRARLLGLKFWNKSPYPTQIHFDACPIFKKSFCRLIENNCFLLLFISDLRSQLKRTKNKKETMADRRAIVPRTLPSSANSVRSTRSAAARQPPPSLLCNLCQKPLATTCFLCACDCIFCEGEWVRVGRATMRLFHWARLLLFCFDSFIHSLAGWLIGFFQSFFFEMNRPTVFKRQIKACFVN